MIYLGDLKADRRAVAVKMCRPEPDLATRNPNLESQRWVLSAVSEELGNEHVFIEAANIPGLTLKVEGTELRLAKKSTSRQEQHWRLVKLDEEGSRSPTRVVSRVHGSEHTMQCLEIDPDNVDWLQVGPCQGRPHQNWNISSSSGDSVTIHSQGQWLTATNQTDCRLEQELQYLKRWEGSDGLVKLIQVIRACSDCGVIGLVLEKLGKQLGPGPKSAHNVDCYLNQLQDGSVRRLAPREVAGMLLPAAVLLQQMHDDGFTHNDLHDGNLLLSSDLSRVKAIDLGWVRQSDHWESYRHLGDATWAIQRDWRSMAYHFISMATAQPDLGYWNLVGTNEHPPRWADRRIQVAFDDGFCQVFHNSSIAERPLLLELWQQLLSRAKTSNAHGRIPALFRRMSQLQSDPNSAIDKGKVLSTSAAILSPCHHSDG